MSEPLCEEVAPDFLATYFQIMSEKAFILSGGIKKVFEIFVEGLEDIDGLRTGLYFVMWEYLEASIDEGADHRVNGKFLRDFNSLLEFLLLLQEHLKKA
jgi:hypothetical protein